MLKAIDCVPDPSDLLAVVDRLRADIDAGRVVGFVGVAICPDDETMAYCGTTRLVTRLRTQGAISVLQHAFSSGEI